MKKNKKVIIFTLITLMLMGSIFFTFADETFSTYEGNNGYQYIPTITEFGDAPLVNLEWSMGSFSYKISGYIILLNGYSYYDFVENDDIVEANFIFVTSFSRVGTDNQITLETYDGSNPMIYKYNQSADGTIYATRYLYPTSGSEPKNLFSIPYNDIPTLTEIGVSSSRDGLRDYATSPVQITISNYYERRPPYMAIIIAILEVFTGIGNWFVEIIPDVLGIFWDVTANGGEGALTILGALAVASLAIAVILLVFRWVTNFFKFRG